MLEKVHIDKKLRILPVQAFARCENLHSVFLPDGVECIRAEVFIRCEKLMTLSLPPSITEIDPSAFAECRKLRLQVSAESFALDYAIENDYDYSIH